jgi:hypothetical protein
MRFSGRTLDEVVAKATRFLEWFLQSKEGTGVAE